MVCFLCRAKLYRNIALNIAVLKGATMKKQPIYTDAKQPIERRVDDLLKRMTIDEKWAQMSTDGYTRLEDFLEKAKNGQQKEIGCIFIYHGFNPEIYNAVQKYQVKKTRLGIPFIMACENTHGVSNPLTTIFPTSGCIAATFDEKLAGKFAKASAIEARTLGFTQLYAPNIDVTWEQRWGRVEENYGEDPYLISVMGAKVVKNFQKQGVCATIKHYIAYGLAEGGINIAPAHIGEREVREYMLPPFEACIKKAKTWSVMPSYNEIDGIPVHASAYWMQKVLREELQFDGMAVSDYDAAVMLKSLHHVADDAEKIGEILCNNGIDNELCGGFAYGKAFKAAVESGKYPISKVNRCVKNILRLKFRLGLFENPYARIDKVKEIHNEKNVALAREIAEKGIVLLKNDGILPLKKMQKIALIGPNAEISQLGNFIYYGGADKTWKHSCVAEESLSLKQVFEKRNGDFLFESGSTFEKTDEEMLKRAYLAASKADVAILALGSNSKGGVFGGAQNENTAAGTSAEGKKRAVTSGEGYDLNSIELTPAQKQLFNAVLSAGKPVVTVIYGGRPLAVTEEAEKSSAMIFGFGAGEQGNQAMYKILYGEVNPSGKLPISFPRSTGHLPCFYNYKPSARGRNYKIPGTFDSPGRDYVFDTPDPLFAFGHGLSYTRFEYRGLRAEKTGKYKFLVSVTVKNTGEADGDEIVLLFLSQSVQRVTPMIKRLRKFRRVSLKRGESKEICFRLSKEDFTFVDVDMKRRAAQGECTISVGDLTEKIIIG